ncbi:MAG TPA: tRNA (adenosine(37)-N6)-threonylcarbamoyltransferase complex ATPase subunit type 1 TsaE [Anaerolineaceae bacterium]|nr:tRNA (adenosine(37)-N6)-threonylcarbamoyltransferase complex ATPase subunit type 1 TsaE [Anaerolineaceae bacterium]HQP08518.1 tRNA (adenosine(37)-N6)-threonylcarbamoyltransferase complex ATPase subunit type 1 TsaE [Anaerolineaceae bacterium]
MPILDRNTLEFISRSPEQTRRLGMRLGSMLQPGDLVCLNGELGSGKTTFVQGLSQGWGSLDIVTSPTFVLVNQYQRMDGNTLYHLDAYRMQNALEAEDLDLVQMIDSGCLVVEWPENIREALPGDCLWIDMKYVAEESRQMVFKPYGERYIAILAEFRRAAFGG